MDTLKIGGVELKSRLLIGTGKFASNKLIPEVIKNCGTQIVTMALRRVDIDSKEENILEYIPKDCILLPNTSGARNAEEAVRIARLGRALGCGNWVKIRGTFHGPGTAGRKGREWRNSIPKTTESANFTARPALTLD